MELKERILVVDDNPDNRLILEELLGESYVLLCVASGEEALRSAVEFQPHLILLDVMMPGLNGIQTCRLLHEQPKLKDAKIVMLSARTDIADRLKAYDVGAVDYITKPFNDQEVFAKIRAWLQMVYKQQIDEMWRDAEQLRELAGSTILTVAEFRNTEPGGHLFRIRWYSQAIAEQLAVSGAPDHHVNESFLRQLYRASPLHDVGKVAVPASVRNKTTPLSIAEFEALKQHTVLGADLLSRAAKQLPNADYLPMAMDIARHHHEHFDGSGYPDRLVGAAIPLAARIVAVADMLDALTSRRVREAVFPVPQAIGMIERNAGGRFDPVMVNALRSRLDDIRQAHSTFMDQHRADDSELIGAHKHSPYADGIDLLVPIENVVSI